MEIKISLLAIQKEYRRITKSLKTLRNKLIGVKEFKEEYDKFIDNIVKFEYLNLQKKVVFLQTKKK